MTTIKQQIEENEEHPFEPFLPKNATKLIIGSIPPQRFWKHKKDSNSLHPGDVNFYYGSRDNSFWDLIGSVFSISFEKEDTENAIKQRTDFLIEKGIGITDVVNKCSRLNGSAIDKHLQITEHKKLEQLLTEHPQIDTLIYTSDFIKQQVNKIFKTYHSSSKKSNKEFNLKIKGKIYKVKILYSPSPYALVNMGEGGAERRLKQYKEIFSD